MQTSAIQPLAVTIPDAARISATSCSTIRRLIDSGDLKAARLGTAVRVRLIDLDDYLARAAKSDIAGVRAAEVVS